MNDKAKQQAAACCRRGLGDHDLTKGLTLRT